MVINRVLWSDPNGPNSNIDAACDNLDLTIIWGKAGFGEVEYLPWSAVAENTKEYLTTWNTRDEPTRRTEPAVICYHEYRDAISDHIGDIVGNLRNEGFVLRHFDEAECQPSRTYYDYEY